MTTNRNLKSAYSFQLEENDDSNGLKLRRISKTGNSEPWNAVFSSTDHLSIRMLGPIASAEDQIAYVFDLNKSSHKSRRTIILRTSTSMLPYGIGQERNDQDLYLFKVSPEFDFEVYVADTTGTDKSILFQMFTDGSFDDEIRELKLRAA